MSALVVSGTLTNSSTGESLQIASLNVTTAADFEQGATIAIGTSEETITVAGDITSPGYSFWLNLDENNYVQIGTATGAYSWTLRPGYFAILPLDAAVATIYLKANNASVNVRYKIYESA